MINISKIIRFNIAGKLLNHAIVFFINICIVRYLGASDSGIYFNELYLINFIALACSLGVDFSVISFLAQNAGLLNALRKKMLLLLLCFACILALLVFAGIPDIIQRYFNQSQLAILLFCVGNLMLIFYQGLLSALKKFNEQNIWLIFSNACFLIWLLFLFDKQDAATDFKTIAMSNAILFVVQGVGMQAMSYSYQSPAVAAISWKSFIKPGIYLLLTSLAYFSFLRIDNFFVEKYCDKNLLGSYVQCGKVGQYFIYFSSIISGTMIPFIANETQSLSYERWRSMMKPYLGLILLAALGVIATGKFIFPLMFGDGFEAMYTIMLVLLPGYIALGLLTLLNAVYIGKGNLKRILAGDVAGFILVLTLDALFIPTYGIYAAAVISSVCYIAVFLFLYIRLEKQFDSHNSKTSIFQLK